MATLLLVVLLVIAPLTLLPDWFAVLEPGRMDTRIEHEVLIRQQSHRLYIYCLHKAWCMVAIPPSVITELPREERVAVEQIPTAQLAEGVTAAERIMEGRRTEEATVEGETRGMYRLMPGCRATCGAW